jgi:S-adenosylmethionine:tRNA ribosyltransferase-isomerase
MRLSDYDFHLPPERIAQHPSAERGQSRLLRVPVEGPFQVGPFSDVLDAFRGDEVLVVNDTRVVPARVFGRKPTGGAVEVFFVEPLEDGRIVAMTRGKRLKPGSIIELPAGAEAELQERRDDGMAVLALSGVPDLWRWLDEAGAIPLPPYIDREATADDAERYQTVFADEPGAVAAPTAGLHFTPEILAALQAKGVELVKLTLHVGPGTFRPVTCDDVRDHPMHAERYVVPEATAKAVRSGRPVVAVGTTVVRALEAWARDPEADRTDLFIYPGFEFALIDGLITNFHLPRSTLLMLVAALAGRERMLAAYRHAIEARLNFYSYGDSSLFRRKSGRWT